MTTTTAKPTLKGRFAKYPASKYAITTQSGLVFFEVKAWKKSPTETVHYLRRLIGHPGDWKRIKFNAQQEQWIFEQLGLQTPLALAQLFGEHFTVCAKCGSPLSDPESIALGIGPHCYKSF